MSGGGPLTEPCTVLAKEKARACTREPIPSEASGGGASGRMALRHAGLVPNQSPCRATSLLG
jgi:hypothetical protein